MTGEPGDMEGVRFGESTSVHVTFAGAGTSRSSPARSSGGSRGTAGRPRRRRLRRAAVWTLVLALIAGAGWLVFLSPHLAVSRVEIEVAGARLSHDDIRKAARVPMGRPLARVDTSEIRHRVEALVPVESAVVERSWPQALRIGVRERKPVAVTDSGALIDRFGVTVETRPPGRTTLPRLAVREPAEDDPAVRAGLAVLSELPDTITRQLEEIKVPTPEEVTLVLNQEDGRKVRVIWGGAARSPEKARIVARLMKQRAEVYDVSSPEVVTLR